MEAIRTSREQALTALLICPGRELGQQFLKAVPDARVFQVLSEMKSYPAANTLDIRLRQLRPDVVLIDVASDQARAAELVQFTARQSGAAQVVCLHHTNDSEAVVQFLRHGAAEFLTAPFEAATQKDAARRLRRLRQPVQEESTNLNGNVIVLSSAKPGAGSSTLATHLAHAIARLTSNRVLLIDLDLEGGTVGFYLKIQASYSAIEALEQASQLDSGVWQELICQSGTVDVLPSPDHPFSQAIDPGRLHDLLEFARSRYDWIVVDTPSVFHRVSLLTMSESDQAFLVSTSDLASLHLSRRAIGLLTQLGFAKERYEVVVNRLSRRDGIGSADLEKIFNAPVHATLPNDYFSLHRVMSLGQALSPDCDLGKAVTALAARVCKVPQPDKKLTLSGVRAALPQT
ncbi:MAG: hypothetical protein FJX76_28550 [Armatimonadetes bacterium]|nr:hypothetical protein [Armatimonadota bacterium]MBM3738296.1 hypothetical protein [Acidobacteriota bacterium]